MRLVVQLFSNSETGVGNRDDGKRRVTNCQFCKYLS